MKGFVIGIIFALVSVAAGVYIYFSYGYAPVATSAEAMPFEKTLANMALKARIEKDAPKLPPIPANEETFVAGAREYAEHCAICHGVPGKPPSPVAEGEFPKPPNLFVGKGVTDDPPGETFWKIENGIRLSGMPAFGKHLTHTQIWQIALLLANANKLPPAAAKALAESPEEALPAGHTHQEAKQPEHKHE